MQLVVDELDRIDQYDTTDETDNNSTEGRNEVTTGRDTYKTRQHAVQRQRKRGLAIFHIGKEHRSRTASSCGKVRGQEHVRDSDAVHFTTGSQLRAGVEAEPS